MTIRSISAFSLALLAVVGCTTLGTTSEPEPAKDASVSPDAGNGADALAAPSAPIEATIGAKGGELENEKIKLTIPAGALAADTKLTIAENGLAPADYGARSPKFRFGPSGTEFAKPVLVVFKVPVTADLTKVKMYWSRKDGAGFDMVATKVAADRTVVGQVTHFSEGFAALPPDTCGELGRVFCGTQGVGTDCANLYIDPNNCGICGNVCIGKGCIDGNCRSEPATCPSGLEACGTNGVGTDCANLDLDPNNCGACGNICLGKGCSRGSCQ